MRFLESLIFTFMVYLIINFFELFCIRISSDVKLAFNLVTCQRWWPVLGFDNKRVSISFSKLITAGKGTPMQYRAIVI